MANLHVNMIRVKYDKFDLVDFSYDAKLSCCMVGLKQIVNLFTGYPSANPYRHSTDSKLVSRVYKLLLVLIAILFKFITTSSANHL